MWVASEMCETPAKCVRVEISSEFKQLKHQSKQTEELGHCSGMQQTQQGLWKYTATEGTAEVSLWYIVDLMVRSFYLCTSLNQVHG